MLIFNIPKIFPTNVPLKEADSAKISQGRLYSSTASHKTCDPVVECYRLFWKGEDKGPTDLHKVTLKLT